MSVFPRITIRGDEKIEQLARDRKQNIRRVVSRSLQDSTEFVQAQVEGIFEESQAFGLFYPGPIGVPWPHRKGEEKYKHPKLVKSGRLSRSIRRSSRVTRRSSGSYYTLGRVYVDTNAVPYAERHQFGEPSNNVPARPFLFLTHESAEDVRDYFGVRFDNLFGQR